MFCFSIKTFFNGIVEWANIFSSESIIKILWGNKCDLSDEKVISSEEGMKKAEQHGMLFFETSALDEVNIIDMFEAMANKINESINHENITDITNNIIIIKNRSRRKASKNRWF